MVGGATSFCDVRHGAVRDVGCDGAGCVAPCVRHGRSFHVRAGHDPVLRRDHPHRLVEVPVHGFAPSSDVAVLGGDVRRVHGRCQGTRLAPCRNAAAVPVDRRGGRQRTRSRQA